MSTYSDSDFTYNYAQSRYLTLVFHYMKTPPVDYYKYSWFLGITSYFSFVCVIHKEMILSVHTEYLMRNVRGHCRQRHAHAPSHSVTQFTQAQHELFLATLHHVVHDCTPEQLYILHIHTQMAFPKAHALQACVTSG